MTDDAPTNYDVLIKTISDQYPTLSKRLRDIASFALEHPTSMALETIANIATAAGVQPSALIRFAKAFGYSGFSEMQRVFQGYVTAQSASYKERIAQDMNATDQSDTKSPMGLLQKYCKENIISLEHLHNGIDADELNKAVELLKNAEHIYLMGQRRSLPIATYLTYALSQAGCRVHLLDGLGGLLKEQCNAMSDKDLLLVSSFHPYANDSLEVVKLIEAKGIPYIAISDNSISPISRGADVAFTVHDAEVHTFRSLTATMMLAQTLATSLLLDEQG